MEISIKYIYVAILALLLYYQTTNGLTSLLLTGDIISKLYFYLTTDNEELRTIASCYSIRSFGGTPPLPRRRECAGPASPGP